MRWDATSALQEGGLGKLREIIVARHDLAAQLRAGHCVTLHQQYLRKVCSWDLFTGHHFKNKTLVGGHWSFEANARRHVRWPRNDWKTKWELQSEDGVQDYSEVEQVQRGEFQPGSVTGTVDEHTLTPLPVIDRGVAASEAKKKRWAPEGAREKIVIELHVDCCFMWCTGDTATR